MPFSKATFEITSAPSPENTCNWKLVFLQMGHYHSKECLDRGDGKECLYVFYNTLCTGISRWRVNATFGNFNSHRNICICFQCLKRHLISSWQHVSSFVNLQFHKFTKIGPITYNQYLTSYRPK